MLHSGDIAKEGEISNAFDFPVSSGLYIYFLLSFFFVVVGCRNPLCHHLIFCSGKKKNSSVSALYQVHQDILLGCLADAYEMKELYLSPQDK